MTDHTSEFRLILGRLRAEKGLSQKELAKASGFCPSAISHFEGGRRNPSLASLLRLADALGVTTDELLGRRSNEDI